MSFQGKKHTKETKKKMSLARKGKIFSKEHRKNLSKALKGKPGYWENKPRSKETKKKISETRIKDKVAKGSNHPNWQGGKIKTKFGYILIKKPEHPFCDKRGYVMEHRLVIEKQIGRHLKPQEKCHHLGEKDDNRPCMLMAFVSQSIHLRFHKDPLLVKPKEIIFDGRKL